MDHGAKVPTRLSLLKDLYKMVRERTFMETASKLNSLLANKKSRKSMSPCESTKTLESRTIVVNNRAFCHQKLVSFPDPQVFLVLNLSQSSLVCKHCVKYDDLGN